MRRLPRLDLARLDLARLDLARLELGRLDLACLAACGFLLSGCHFASSPLAGFGGFIDDTHTLKSNPNLPAGDAENMRRAEGQSVASDPLTPEPGNIWPGPPKAEPTLEDVIRDEPPADQSGGQPGGPASNGVPPASSAHPQPRPQGSGSTPDTVPYRSEPNAPGVAPTAPGSITVPPATITTPGGVQSLNHGANGITTTTTPGGASSIVVPNGNGTSTVIGPDGSTQTVPTPK